MWIKSLLLTYALVLPVLSAQVYRAGTLVSSGYRIPAGLLTAAPGQLSLLSLNGIPAKSVPAVVAPLGPAGYPRELNGVQVHIAMTDGALRDATLRAVQQTGCEGSVNASCMPLTTLTVLFPEDLGVVANTPWFDQMGTLTVMNGTERVAEFPLRLVADNLHILNSCDETLIQMGIFSDAANASSCLPDIILGQRLVNTDNPLVPGSAVAAYLYGGGATDLRNGSPARKDTVQEFSLHFDYRPNAPGALPVQGYSLTGKPFSSVGYAGGLYQLNFTIPPVPNGVRVPKCDGAAIRSNLTITISGANSMDSASFCIEPQ